MTSWETKAYIWDMPPHIYFLNFLFHFVFYVIFAELEGKNKSKERMTRNRGVGIQITIRIHPRLKASLRYLARNGKSEIRKGNETVEVRI